MEKEIFTIKENTLSYGRGYVYSLQYHLVWCTKYRKQVLKNGIDAECKKMLYELAEEYKNAPRGAHCGGKEECRCRDPPHAENPARRILFHIRYDKDYEGESGTSVISFASGIKTGAVGRTFVESIVLCSYRK